MRKWKKSTQIYKQEDKQKLKEYRRSITQYTQHFFNQYKSIYSAFI